MKVILTFFTAFMLSGHALACSEISGTYRSVSESHWNFELVIEDESAILIYTNSISGVGDTRTDEQTISRGHCEISGGLFKLSFAEKEITFTHHNQLSRASFGGQGFSAGITGNFYEDSVIELWLSL